MEAGTATDIREDAEKADPGLVATQKIAAAVPEPDKDGKLEAEEERSVVSATGWLLQSFDERSEEVTRPLELNVGSASSPQWMPWVIKTVPGPDLRRIRARAADQLIDGAARRGTKTQASTLADTNTAARANAEIVLAGTLNPDLVEVAQMRGLADAAILVEEAFKKKPGLVDLLSAAIMELSGYDDAAVRDSTEVAAAGNSPG